MIMQVKVNVNDFVKGSNLIDSVMTASEKKSFILAVSDRMEPYIEKYCPVKTGLLKSSLQTYETPTGIIYLYDVPYAAYVHEILYRKHKRPTRAKWVEQAFRQALRELKYEFGKNEIPSFYVSLKTKPTFSFEISTEDIGLNWRDFV